MTQRSAHPQRVAGQQVGRVRYLNPLQAAVKREREPSGQVTRGGPVYRYREFEVGISSGESVGGTWRGGGEGPRGGVSEWKLRMRIRCGVCRTGEAGGSEFYFFDDAPQAGAVTEHWAVDSTHDTVDHPSTESDSLSVPGLPRYWSDGGTWPGWRWLSLL